MTLARELTMTAADGTPLHVADWPANHWDKVRGNVVLMHGLGEHCGRYAHVARFFNDCGWAVRTYDHRDAKIVLDDFSRQFDTPPGW